MHVALIVPAPFDAVSGGYIYDRRIVAGLREAGHTVRVIELAGAHPLADDARARCGLRRVGQHRLMTRGRSSMASRCRRSPVSRMHCRRAARSA